MLFFFQNTTNNTVQISIGLRRMAWVRTRVEARTRTMAWVRTKAVIRAKAMASNLTLLMMHSNDVMLRFL